MKTIVLATDFSSNANKVAHFAMQLAQAQKATLILMHAFHFWPGNPAETGMDFPLSAKAMHDDKQSLLTHLAHTLTEQYGTDVPIHCITKEGYPIPAIREVAEAEKADLIIMSTTGTAPQSAQLMGSVATSMVAETTVPLLLVPPSVGYADVKNVVLGVDLDTPPNAVALDTALRFARQFGSVVNLLCIYPQPADARVRTRAEHIRELMVSVPHTMTILLDEDIYDTLLTFAHENKADLIMMIPQTHSWFRRLFVEGQTERMARLTDIPLLAIV
ncbi:universal stress protein [Spirosoma pulveris]